MNIGGRRILPRVGCIQHTEVYEELRQQRRLAARCGRDPSSSTQMFADNNLMHRIDTVLRMIHAI